MDFAARCQVLFDAYTAAYDAKDAGACAACYLPDGALRSPFGPAATGRAAIAATHASWFETIEKGKTLKVLDAAARDDLGYCLVAYSAQVAQPDGTDSIEAGTSLNILSRQPDGSYLIRHTSLVPDQTQAG